MAVEERPRPRLEPEVGMSRMLVTKHFLFLHVPRTGGQFLRGLCYRHLPADWLVPNGFGPHRGYSEVAGVYPDLPMFCCVRNPWDWYVSSIRFVIENSSEQGRGPMWQSAFDSGNATFKEVVIRACTGESFENPRTRPVMDKRDLDHYSALFWLTAGEGVEAGRVEVGKLESVAD